MSAPRIYRIIRFRFNGTPRTMQEGLTLEEARAHCADPGTRKEGVYFDGYDYMPGNKPRKGEEDE